MRRIVIKSNCLERNTQRRSREGETCRFELHGQSAATLCWIFTRAINMKLRTVEVWQRRTLPENYLRLLLH
jgi:hypothetical protein